jgi:hypothetical protein
MNARAKIEKVVEFSSQADFDHGVAWYGIAHRHARELAREFGVGLETASALIAVLSPNNSWQGNLKDARRVLEARRLGVLDQVRVKTYPLNLAKAKRLLNGERPGDVLRGPKVLAFYGNILRPGTPGFVTIDFHITNLCRGKHEPMKDSKVPSRSEREECIEAIWKVAEDRGLLPQQVQAVAWVSWKRANGAKAGQGQLDFGG